MIDRTYKLQEGFLFNFEVHVFANFLNEEIQILNTNVGKVNHDLALSHQLLMTQVEEPWDITPAIINQLFKGSLDPLHNFEEEPLSVGVVILLSLNINVEYKFVNFIIHNW